MGRVHHSTHHKRAAKLVTDAAYADPSTRCQATLANGATCGRTLAEHPPTRTGKAPSWDAGHVIAGDPNSPLRPEVASCNRAEGARMTNHQRRSNRPSRPW